MSFSKKDIERARERLWTKEASRQLGREVQDLSEVEMMNQGTFKPLGETLAKKSKRLNQHHKDDIWRMK